ncbi:MAG: GNAT family N-acetyltransferase [Ignavibacteria bacterium]
MSGNVDGLLLAIKNKIVIGQLGLIPVKLYHKEKIYDAQWACDLLVDPGYRKQGIGRLLFEAGMKRDAVSLGNNASPSADKLMIDIGFKPVPSGRTMVFPLDINHLLKWIIPTKINFSIPLLSKFIQPYYTFKKKTLHQKSTNYNVCLWEEIIDLINKKQSEIKCPKIIHDIDFMNWRANGLEKFTQKVSAAKNNSKSFAVYSAFLPYFNVYEWNCSDREDLKSLLALMINLAIESKASTLQMVANNSEEEKWLSSLGFIRSRNIERIIHYSKENILGDADSFYFTLYDTDLNL